MKPWSMNQVRYASSAAADVKNVCVLLLTCHDEPIEDAPSYAPTYMVRTTIVSQTPGAAPMHYGVQAQLSTKSRATYH